MDIFSLKKKKKIKYVILTQFYSNEFYISYCCISYLLNRYRFFDLQFCLFLRFMS